MLSVRRRVDGVLVSELELFARRRANMACEGKGIVISCIESGKLGVVGEDAG